VKNKVGKAKRKGRWKVKVRCIVMKELILDNCTIEQANDCPWDFAESEEDLDQEDWEVITVEKEE
jgi:hypothetical protein